MSATNQKRVQIVEGYEVWLGWVYRLIRENISDYRSCTLKRGVAFQRIRCTSNILEQSAACKKLRTLCGITPETSNNFSPTY